MVTIHANAASVRAARDLRGKALVFTAQISGTIMLSGISGITG
jgi:hypothetical protein